MKNTTLQKWHPTWMASHNSIIGFLKYYQFNTLQVEPTPTIRHRRVIRISLSTLKSNDHESKSYNKFKSFLLKITHLSPWLGIFSQGVPVFWGTIFCACHICLFQVEYLPCAIFVRCHFQMTLKGVFFCLMYLMVV